VLEQAPQVGGQFRLAMQVPGKEEFGQTLRYYTRRLEVLGAQVRTGIRAQVPDLADADQVVVATGVTPRVPDIPGIDHPQVCTYAQVLSGAVVPGQRVAVIGAGGIGVDVAHWLTHTPETLPQWMAHWGVGDPAQHPGGLTEQVPRIPARQVTLVQRKETRVGADLGRTSGWVHRAGLRQNAVTQVPGASYVRVDDAGLHLLVAGEPVLVECDHVVVCAGQEPVRGLHAELLAAGRPAHLIGGADVATELDAQRAIEQGMRVVVGLG
jgi:2,4-dienoyl-CoA reductase (NADPH2)